jgi:hypothetical protein
MSAAVDRFPAVICDIPGFILMCPCDLPVGQVVAAMNADDFVAVWVRLRLRLLLQ